MLEAEQIGIPYLLKLRQTPKVKQLIEKLFLNGQWTNALQGWQGSEARLKLQGWSSERRVVVLRRELKDKVLLAHMEDEGQRMFSFIETAESVKQYEYAVLVTSLEDKIDSLAQHYRDRADSENVFDELKNQWGWSGFTTQDIHRCQVMACHTALVYNWWSLFARLAIPERHAEAIVTADIKCADIK